MWGVYYLHLRLYYCTKQWNIQSFHSENDVLSAFGQVTARAITGTLTELPLQICQLNYSQPCTGNNGLMSSGFFNATRFIIFNPRIYQNYHLLTGWQLITPVALQGISDITVSFAFAPGEVECSDKSLCCSTFKRNANSAPKVLSLWYLIYRNEISALHYKTDH